MYQEQNVGADAYIGRLGTMCKEVSPNARAKPLLEERWHAQRDGEVCRRAAAAARKRPSAHAETLRQTFGAVTPLSHGCAMTAPLKGSLLSQAPGLIDSTVVAICYASFLTR